MSRTQVRYHKPTACPFAGVAMADGQKRRMLDQVGGSPTLIAQGSRIMGDIETAGALIVFGAIRGDGRVGGTLSMATESAWEGEVWAQQAVIAGTVVGRL